MGLEASLGDHPGLSRSTIARRDGLEDMRNASPRDMAAVVMDTRIDAVLVMLREREATPVALAEKVAYHCALGCRSGFFPGSGVIIEPCNCHIHLQLPYTLAM